jgi:hypothetical protein
VLGDEAQGGEVEDELLRDLGVEAPVELVDRLERWHLRLLQAALGWHPWSRTLLEAWQLAKQF